MKVFMAILLAVFNLNVSATCSNQSDLDILAWSYKAMMASYGFNFITKPEQLKQTSAEYYNEEGFKAYQEDLAKYNYLEKAQKDKLIYSVALSNAPLLIQKGMLDQKMAWKIQVPVLLIAQSANNFSSSNKLVTMQIVQEDNCLLKITQFEVK